jgi:hypothetical protein
MGAVSSKAYGQNCPDRSWSAMPVAVWYPRAGGAYIAILACDPGSSRREEVPHSRPMNKPWHDKNKMPPKATLEQRINWHKEHQEHCACREAPKSLLKYFELKK